MATETDINLVFKQRLKNRDQLLLQIVARTQFRLGKDKDDPVKLKQALREVFLKLLKQYTARMEKDKKIKSLIEKLKELRTLENTLQQKLHLLKARRRGLLKLYKKAQSHLFAVLIVCSHFSQKKLLMEEEIAHIRFVRDVTIERSMDFLMNMKPAFCKISSFDTKIIEPLKSLESLSTSSPSTPSTPSTPSRQGPLPPPSSELLHGESSTPGRSTRATKGLQRSVTIGPESPSTHAPFPPSSPSTVAASPRNAPKVIISSTNTTPRKKDEKSPISLLSFLSVKNTTKDNDIAIASQLASSHSHHSHSSSTTSTRKDSDSHKESNIEKQQQERAMLRSSASSVLSPPSKQQRRPSVEKKVRFDISYSDMKKKEK